MAGFAGSVKRHKTDDDRFEKSESEYGSPLGIVEKRRAAMDSHCEIERRRRNKMAALVNELSDIVPACNLNDKRKPDKLTILKLAADHLKALQISDEPSDENSSRENKSRFITDAELKKLVIEATSGFLFVVLCDSGQLIYVSDTVTDILGVSQLDWSNTNMYDLIHPEDRNLLRQQLQQVDHEPFHQNTFVKTSNGETDTDSKSDLCRRSFIVKMKLGGDNQNNTVNNNNCRDVVVSSVDGTCYAVVHVTGYIRQWPSSASEYGHPPSSALSQSCLVAIGHRKQRIVSNDEDNSALSSSSSSCLPLSFVARHKTSGIFTFVDSGVTKFLGYKPVQLLQSSIFEFCHKNDLPLVEEAFAQVVEKKDQVVNINFRFLNSSKVFVPLKLSCSTFINPFSEVVEYVSTTFTSLSSTKGTGPAKVHPQLSANSVNFNELSSNLEKRNYTSFPSMVGQHQSYNLPVLQQHQQINPSNTAAWVETQRKVVGGHHSTAPPDYHNHLNNSFYSAAGPVNPHYQLNNDNHCISSNTPTTYQWSLASQDMIPGHSNANIVQGNASSFTSSLNSAQDVGGAIDNGNSTLWTPFHPSVASTIHPGVDPWHANGLVISAGNVEGDASVGVDEVMNIFGSGPTLFNIIDENLIKKYCSS